MTLTPEEKPSSSPRLLQQLLAGTRELKRLLPRRPEPPAPASHPERAEAVALIVKALALFAIIAGITAAIVLWLMG